MAERLEFNLYGDWLNPHRGYLYGDIIDSETFQSTPYTEYRVYLIALHEGYGYHDGQYAVLVEWVQEGDPEYSDCDEVQEFNVYDSENKARERFQQLIKEYATKYPS